MHFLDILKGLVKGIKGGIGATLMGTDGISIQKYTADDCDIETIGIEYGKVIDEIKNASAILNLGEVEEVLVATAGIDVFIRLVTSEYYIILLAAHGPNSGRSRFLLKQAASKARKELSA